MGTLSFLGTGPSQGIPMIGCECKVCKSKDPRDIRLRTSVLIETERKKILIDPSPDFRFQMLRAGETCIDTVLITHEHRDHTGGMDELRGVNRFTKKEIPVYAEKRVMRYLERAFPYVFSENKYPGAAPLVLHEVNSETFVLEGGIKILPIRVKHFQGLPILGYRIEDLSYITDAKTISQTEIEKLLGSKILVINALRREYHPSHFSLEEALALIDKVQPEEAYITHIGHRMGLYDEVSRLLSQQVTLAYDGMKIEL